MTRGKKNVSVKPSVLKSFLLQLLSILSWTSEDDKITFPKIVYIDLLSYFHRGTTCGTNSITYVNKVKNYQCLCFSFIHSTHFLVTPKLPVTKRGQLRTVTF